MSPGLYWPKGSAIEVVLIVLMLNYVTEITGFRLTNMTVPDLVDPRENLELGCYFDIGNEELYALKWYKDGNEFFRYMPQEDRKMRYFPVFGVFVDDQKSSCDNSHCKLTLKKLSREESSGSYRCEISSEAPSFRLASDTHNVIVAAVPRENPKIEGLESYYSEGDILSANCTSDFGDPAPTLRWYVDDEPIIPVSRPTYISRASDILVAQSILLEMMVANVSKATLNIACDSSIIGVPFAPQHTMVVVALRSTKDPGVSHNEILQRWYSPYFYSSAILPSLSHQLVLSIILVVVVRWPLEH
ncbi:unnamed protein product [Psylliodes chrysocephalus]|uniref:Ig-like domain-containing protein n=1 Tax=Psylliodes chrysocephalus TaxID=3402493 RepID=A0A9P0CRF7_9CUCU|nr:unnamed protein product [Psylliodes chrysocephala]